MPVWIYSHVSSSLPGSADGSGAEIEVGVGTTEVTSITGEETGVDVAATETLSTTGDETGIEIETELAEDALDDLVT